MQRWMLWFVMLAVLLLPAAPLAAAPKKPKPPSCRQIQKAISANHTWEQILREFDTDAAHVAKCMPKGGKRRATPKATKAKPTAKAQTPPKPAASKPGSAPRRTSGDPTRPRSVP